MRIEIGGDELICLQLSQSGTGSVAEIRVVEIMDIAPETVIAVPAFRNETMDMGIPF